MKNYIIAMLFAAPAGLAAQEETQTAKSTTEPARPSFLVEQDIRTINRNSQSSSQHFNTFDFRYEGTRGSAWLWEDWKPGEILLADNQMIAKNVAFRFDASKNELHIKSTKDTAVKILYNTDILRVSVPLDGNTLILRKLDIPGQKPAQLYVQLYAGTTYEAFALVEKVVRKADFGHPLGPDRRYDEWLVEKDYFLKTGEKFKKFKLTRSGLEKVLPARADRYLEKETFNDVLEAELVELLITLEAIKP
jgi:hypothetical protein